MESVPERATVLGYGGRIAITGGLKIRPASEVIPLILDKPEAAVLCLRAGCPDSAPSSPSGQRLRGKSPVLRNQTTAATGQRKQDLRCYAGEEFFDVPSWEARIMIKRFVLILVAAGAIAAAAAQAVLPALSGLSELKIEQFLDFADHPVAGLPWLGHLNGPEFVFYDVKLQQVFRASLPGGKVHKIGGPGQGPGEYQGVQDIHLEGETVHVLDGRGRIIAYGRDGKAVREMKPPQRFERFIGRRGDLYYLEGRSSSPEAFHEKAVSSWREGRDPEVLLKSTADVIETKASDLSGRAMGGGHFTLSEPVFVMNDEGFIEASGNRYRLRFFDLSGKAAGTWIVTAPEPEFIGSIFKSYIGKRAAYAVRAVFPVPSGLAVIGNFYCDGRPRLDIFDRHGRLRASYLIPLSWEAPFSRCQIENGCLIYFSSQDGCRIYRIISPI